MGNAKITFWIVLLLVCSGIVTPPTALAAGLAFGLMFEHPFPGQARKGSKFLLQAAVVGLGFGMNLHQVLAAGRSGFVYTAAGITLTLLLGLVLGRVLYVPPRAAFLISTGTAICGGSAIAAMAPLVNANEEEIAVSLGTVFMLNSAALLTFPVIGWMVHLTQPQFGLWAALAIHDTSSVVGATHHYGPVALMIGTAVKLARALWIVPLSVATAMVRKSNARIQWPWFILFFCLAAVANTYIHLPFPLFDALHRLGTLGLTVTLFLIGSSISRKTIQQVGPRPLLQGIVLWITVATISLELVRLGWIHI